MGTKRESENILYNFLDLKHWKNCFLNFANYNTAQVTKFFIKRLKN